MLRAAGRTDERGSVLILVPAGFLVLLLLGGIAVDSAVAYLGQRQLVDAVAGAANDAATAALDDASFYGRGALRIDPSSAAAVVCRSVLAQGDADLHALTIEIAIAGPVIRVRARAQVDAVFGRLIPGYGHRAVSGEGTASAVGAGAVPSQQPAAFVPVTCDPPLRAQSVVK